VIAGGTIIAEFVVLDGTGLTSCALVGYANQWICKFLILGVVMLVNAMDVAVIFSVKEAFAVLRSGL
jgi:hypothetical protein